jgi:outer membrane receptor for monomeric catechols
MVAAINENPRIVPFAACNNQPTPAASPPDALVPTAPSVVNCIPAKSVGTLYKTSPESVIYIVFSGSSQPFVGSDDPAFSVNTVGTSKSPRASSDMKS